MNIGTMMARLGVDVAPLIKAGAKMRAFANSTVASMGKIKRSVMGLQGAIIGMAGTYVMAHLATSAVKTAMAFEQSMLTVKGVTRATADEFAAMEDMAKQMGETTEWTATQSANALQFLGMAGFKAMEATQALPGVLDLATAGNIDLARAADIASNALTAMQLPVSELSRVNDVFVATITRTNTNMEMMAESFKYAAPVGKAFGYEIEELSAMVGQLGNAGIQGSMAGTQLAFAMQKVTKVAKDLGIDSTKLVDVLQAMKDQGWSNERMLKAFGMRGGRAVLVLKDMIPQLRGLTVELKNSKGEAKALADTMRQSLRVQFITLGSAIESVAIKAFEIYEEDLKNLLKNITLWVREHKDAIVETLGGLYNFFKGMSTFLAQAGAGLGIVAAKILYGPEKASEQLAEKLTIAKANLTALRGEFNELKSQDPGEDVVGWTEEYNRLEKAIEKAEKNIKNLTLAQKRAREEEVKRNVSYKRDFYKGWVPLSEDEFAPITKKVVEQTKDNQKEMLTGYSDYVSKILQFETDKAEEIGRLAMLEQQYKEEAWQKTLDARAAYEAMTWEGIKAGYWAEYNMMKEVEAGVKESLDSLEQKSKKTFGEELKGAIEGWASDWSKTLTDMVWGSETSFDDILKSFGKMLTQMVMQKLIVEPLLNFGFSFFKKAKGGAFINGVERMRSGGIVNRPTFIPLQTGAAMIGEAGPEGVLPLTRTRTGDLGVKTEGAIPNVQVNVINESSQPVTAEQRGQPTMQAGQFITNIVLKDLQSRGPIHQGITGIRR